MKKRKCNVIVIGPHPDGLGGISRVVKIWEENGVLKAPGILYLSTVADGHQNRVLFLAKALIRFTELLFAGVKCVYIHTSSKRSFYRKSIFIFLSAIFQKQIILHIHPTHFYNFIVKSKRIIRWYIKFTLGLVDRFAVLTEKMKSKMMTLFPTTPTFVIPNPINSKLMVNSSAWKRSEKFLLYLGWYIKEKGVYDLVDAVEILIRKGYDLQLKMYGTKKVEKLRRYVNSKDLKRAVEINGWISREDKIRAFYECTLLILPSYSEGIPNVILEAMATQTPIISTAVGGLEEILRDNENAVIAPVKDSQKLSEAIVRCLTNSQLRNRIAKQAYEDALSNFDIGIVKERFYHIVSI